MKNVLLEEVEYKIERSRLGLWRRYLYPTGSYFAEFKSHRKLFGLPLIHYTRGICPETGKRVVAKGIVAVGRLAAGVFAIGHAAIGVVAVGQLGIGILFGIGQVSTGIVAIGQLAIGVLFGLGQIATGFAAMGQVGIGKYVLAQIGFGKHVWSQSITDQEAMNFFKLILSSFIFP